MKHNIKLTRRQKAFADHLLSNPRESATKAVEKTYAVTSYGAARAIASENLTKPNIQLYLNEHVEKAKNRVVQLIDSEKEEIALRASDSVLDRVLGKATQRTEISSTSVNLNLSLTDITE